MINILVHMGDDIKDNESKSEILLGAIILWPSSLFIDASPSMSTPPLPTKNKRVLGCEVVQKFMS
jgi:hypothetical protein